MHLKFIILKEQVLEFFRYDLKWFMTPCVLLAYMGVFILSLVGKRILAFKIVSSVFRSGWYGSYTFGVYFSNKWLKSEKYWKALVEDSIADVQPLDNTKKFFEHPEKLLNGIIKILKAPVDNEKGVLILNYSYYFLLFPKFFNLAEIEEKYIIILEPSWAGFMEIGILAFSKMKYPVYLMCYEERDEKFIDSLYGSLTPVSIGPSWFVNHKKFDVETGERDIDIIMVAGWARFKRHWAFFKAMSKSVKNGFAPKIVLVGYPTDLSTNYIKLLANHYGLGKSLEIHEWIKPEEVAQLLNRSKINILWSRFEGNNRAIIEGMFCNTAVIMREGHNYGQKYDFINEQTGKFANEGNLSDIVVEMLKNYDSYSPRDYVLQNRSCIKATSILNEVISCNELDAGRQWSKDIEIKVNELHQMEYFDESVKSNFIEHYESLKLLIK